MNKLLAGAWGVFAFDLLILAMMAKELLTGDIPEADRTYATWVTGVFAVWVCVVNIVLLVGWWRDSRAALWAAVVCGALPILWAWTAAVQLISG